MEIQKTPFGTTLGGEAVSAYRLQNETGLAATVLDYGCTLQALWAPPATGGGVDVVLGYDSLLEYEQNGGYFGAAIGRVANRIAGGHFTLLGKDYRLFCNDGQNHLHGGQKGFDQYVWAAEETEAGLRLSRLSPAGEEGYPGNLNVTISYSLIGPALHILYEAESDADTLVNLTNHSYFNLNGGGSVLNHTLQLEAKEYCENGPGCLPTGRLLPVAGTPFDFGSPKAIGRDILEPNAQLAVGGGYDHNYVLAGSGMRRVALLQSPQSGLCMEVYTDQPGMQLYSGNFVSPRKGKNGGSIEKHGALCLETQTFPDSIHHPAFPGAVLKKGERYRSETIFVFQG